MPRQLPNPVVNPLRCSGQQRQPVIWPDNVYGNEAPVDILRRYDTFDVSRPLSDQSPDQQEGSNDLTLADNIQLLFLFCHLFCLYLEIHFIFLFNSFISEIS